MTKAALSAGATLSFALLAMADTASAQDRAVLHEESNVEPYEGSTYHPLEIESHLTFGPDNVYGSSGFGGGLRLSVPLVGDDHGSFSDDLAISFGADVLHYNGCFFGEKCGANYLSLPVAVQWNVWLVSRRVSVFAEAGLFAYKGWFHACSPAADPGCLAPSDNGVLPTLALGGRVRVGTSIAFVARVGYPTTTLGFSFL
jgi:hypothetical protein